MTRSDEPCTLQIRLSLLDCGIKIARYIKIHVFVEGLRVFPTFEEMYRAIPAKDLDCEGSTLQEMLDETYEIYTPDQDAKWFLNRF
jgi:ASC-1-like (ASCH) protein